MLGGFGEIRCLHVEWVSFVAIVSMPAVAGRPGGGRYSLRDDTTVLSAAMNETSYT